MRAKYQPLPASFFRKSPEEVANRLLGAYVVRKLRGKLLVGMIVETEAYLPQRDEASHSFRGKDKCNASLFKDAGHAYVHQSRHHLLLDIVADKEHIGSGVLIRALEPIENIRGKTNGPARLCKSLHITKKFDGIDVRQKNSPLYIARGINIEKSDIQITTRVGITKSADLPLRFYIKHNPFVSRK